MKVLIIPDIHLKPWMFEKADKIMQEKSLDIDIPVCLGDIPDDFKKKNDSNLVKETFSAAETFLHAYPDTLWCIGNHEASYLWNEWQSGMAYHAKKTTEECVKSFYDAIGNVNPENLAFVHRIGNVIFSHAGVRKKFLDTIYYLPEGVDGVIARINSLHKDRMWKIDSPLWWRPQTIPGNVINEHLWRGNDFLQVVGHTPVEQITQKRNLLSCDTFSLYPNRKPYGDQTFCLLDTESHEWKAIPTN